MQHLPKEIVQIILAYCNANTLARAELVCKEWQKIISQTSWQVLYINTTACEHPETVQNRTYVVDSCVEWYEHVTGKEFWLEHEKLEGTSTAPRARSKMMLLHSNATPRKIPYPKNLKQACLRAQRKKFVGQLTIKAFRSTCAIAMKHWVFVFDQYLNNGAAVIIVDASAMKIVGNCVMEQPFASCVVRFDRHLQAEFFQKNSQVTRAAVFVIVTIGRLDVTAYKIEIWEQNNQDQFKFTKMNTTPLPSACYYGTVWNCVFPLSKMTIICIDRKYYVYSNYCEQQVAAVDISDANPNHVSWIEVAKGAFEVHVVSQSDVARYFFSLQNPKLIELTRVHRLESPCSSVMNSRSGFFMYVEGGLSNYASIFALDFPKPYEQSLLRQTAKGIQKVHVLTDTYALHASTVDQAVIVYSVNNEILLKTVIRKYFDSLPAYVLPSFDIDDYGCLVCSVYTQNTVTLLFFNA